MKLFKYDNYTLSFEPELLTLKVFKTLHKRDKSATKDKFLQELAYIYFFSDPRSDYQYIIDEEERANAIIEGEGLPKGWKPDKEVLEARDYYASFKPTSALLLDDTRFMIDKFRSRMKEIASQESLEVKELKDMAAMIKQIPGLIKDLDEAEKALTRDMEALGRARGGNNKTLLDDGLDNLF